MADHWSHGESGFRVLPRESVSQSYGDGSARRYLRAPRALPRLVYPGVASVVYEEERVLRLVLLDEPADAHHQFQMGILRWDGEDVRVEAVVLPQASLEILKLREDEQVIGAPMEQEGLDILVSL